MKTFGYSTSCAPRSVLGALLSNGPEGCQAGIKAANTRNNASALTVSIGPQISCGYFGITASRHSETMPDHLSLRSHSICEAVHTLCDRCREIEKTVMPVTPCFPTRTTPPLCWGSFQASAAVAGECHGSETCVAGSNSASPDAASLALLRRFGSKQTLLPGNVMSAFPQKLTLEA